MMGCRHSGWFLGWRRVAPHRTPNARRNRRAEDFRSADAERQRPGLSAISTSPGARAFYDEQRAKGHGHNDALRRLANRLVGILGVAIRPAAFSGALLLLMMWAAVWAPAKISGGQPSGSTNPIVDDHIIGIFGLIVLAGLATWGVSYLGRKWASLRVIQTHPWLR